MQKSNTTAFSSFLCIVVVLFLVFFSMTPQYDASKEYTTTEFSTKRALEKVKAMTKQPHYVGSPNHETVARYLFNELQSLGLKPEIQEGFTLSDGGTLVKSKNVLAKIKGSASSKALVLLSHYDSAPHSKSLGASDDASGVAVILESIRAYQANKQQPKNDIIVLFTDAEELGLNGAALFATEHKWAKEVGLAINFEARGSAGPGYMLMETNQGNAKMVEAFQKGNSNYTVSNSLMYSIYKMLPNDTDLTVFRQQGNIQGFNFAFIDNHFNYHTQQDTYENLNRNSLMHQGANLFPLLKYFANADLTDFNSQEDKVYFSIPYAFVTYPFDWVFPMLILVSVLFLGFLFVGIAKQILLPGKIFQGFVPFLGALTVSGLIAFFGWKLLLKWYPQYGEIQQGFTYNGHDYIYAFVCLTLAICFLFYHTKQQKPLEYNQLIAPLFFWIIINALIAFKLQGAGFYILPVLVSTLLLGYHVITQKSNSILNLVLAVPTLVILAPFVQMFPIGLGLKILVVSAVLTVLIFGLLLPVFGIFSRKKLWALLFFGLSLAFFVKAHQSSGYEKGKAKPNSLLYIFNVDQQKAYWATYDTNLDEWTKGYLGEKPVSAEALNKNKMYSKYKAKLTLMTKAPVKNLKLPTIEFVKDSVIGNKRYLKITITPNRKVNRYDIFSNGKPVSNLKANGVEPIEMKSKIGGTAKNKLLTYYVVDNIPLTMEFETSVHQKLDMELKESSFDLLENPLFSIAKRRDWMMPMPFILNDAIVIEQKIKPTPKITVAKNLIVNPDDAN
jgi:hypothetical protein